MNAISEGSRVSLSETYFGSAVSNALMSRLASTVNYIIDNQIKFPLGSVVKSMLTEAQFQTAKGSVSWLSGSPYSLALASTTTWILADGRSIVGSSLNALTGMTSFNSLGLYERGNDGSFSIGTNFLSSQNLQHTHSAIYTNPSNWSNWGVNDAGNGPDGKTVATTNPIFFPFASAASLTSIIGTSFLVNAPIVAPGVLVGSEARPHSIVVNYFVKINY